MSSSSSERPLSDVASHAERLRALTLGRAIAAVGMFGTLGTVGRGLVDPELWPVLAAVAATHGLLQVLALIVTSGRWRDLSVPLAEVALLVDVAALAVVLLATGGVHGPLAGLLLVEVVAVTLLFGRWAGLRGAVLGSLAVVWLLPSSPPLPLLPGADRTTELAVDPTLRGALLLVLLWGTTAITGWLSNVTEKDLRARTEDLALLREITPDLDPRRGTAELAQALAEVCVQRLGHGAAAVWLPVDPDETDDAGEGEDVDEERAGGLRLLGQAAVREHPSLVDLPEDLPQDHALLVDGEPRVRPLRAGDPRPEALVRLFGPDVPLLLVPLPSDPGTPGLLALSVPTRLGRRAVVRARQVRVLRMLVEQASLLLGNARLQAELERQATRDAVTGLPNHRVFQQRLGEELERVSRLAQRGEHRAVSLALVDLDRFKAVNDTYGHPTGDAVLAAVGQALTTTLRGTDVACRYGGEEFAVVLTDADADAARVAADRLRAAVSALRVTATDGRALGPITASVGLATVVDARLPKATVVDRADAALYAAKRGGRDRTVHHDDLPLIDVSRPSTDPARPGGDPTDADGAAPGGAAPSVPGGPGSEDPGGSGGDQPLRRSIIN